MKRKEGAEMLVTITDFANARNEDRDTVNAYIRKHPEIQKDVSRQGKNTVIDTLSEGYALLEKQYPLPQMVQIIEDTESREKLIKAQELIIQMQGKMAELQDKVSEQSMIIATAEATKMLLEDKTKELERIENMLEKAEARVEKAETRAEMAEEQKTAADDEIAALRKELEVERNKSWWDKLRGR